MEKTHTSGPLVGYRVLDLAGPPGLHSCHHAMAQRKDATTILAAFRFRVDAKTHTSVKKETARPLFCAFWAF